MNSICEVSENGTKSWHLNGQRHRVDGPAVERANGSKEWWLNGQRHRVDGPAIEWKSGTKEWWLNDKRHRVDGPAIEWMDGLKEWWLNNVIMSYDKFVLQTNREEFREVVIALLPLQLPSYELLAMMEHAFPQLATPQHHRACIQLIMGMTASRRRIKSID